jgi:hypothetical protein
VAKSDGYLNLSVTLLYQVSGVVEPLKTPRNMLSAFSFVALVASSFACE